MLKYLIIPLADNAISFCHYTADSCHSQNIPIDILKNAIVWAMKRDLSIQFLYPRNPLTNDIICLTETIDHVKIVPSDIYDKELLSNSDIVVFNNWQELDNYKYAPQQSHVIRTSFVELFANKPRLHIALTKSKRINIVITDINGCMEGYENFLQDIIPIIIEEYKHGHQIQLNILTDRIMLKGMNNCNAGYESLTLATDGNFYICPAFRIEGEPPIGNIQRGVDLKNPHLFKISHAPICRQCDAWQCKRCIWLNTRLTREVNTPSHQQCAVSHIERKASKYLLEEFRKIDPSFMNGTQITGIDYLDPFENIIKNK